MRTWRGVVLVSLLILAGPASAGTDGPPERVTVDIGGCDSTLERRTVEPSVLVFRTECRAMASSTTRALDAALTARFPNGTIDGEVGSVSVGRIVELPWLSQNLAETAARDQGWSTTVGAPREGSAEAYVGALLTREGLASPLYGPLAKRGLRVTSVTVEKVLVADADGRRLPVDAQLWLRVERGAAGTSPTAPR
jgi:hypothetical protein